MPTQRPCRQLLEPAAGRIESYAEAWLLAVVVAVAVAVGCQEESVTSSGTAPAPPAEVPAKQELSGAEAASSTDSAVKSDRIVDKTFDDIKFDIEPDAPYDRSMLTPEINDLVGQRIRIRGYIFPTFQREGITSFVLVRDNQECCFGPGAALYDCIRVEMIPSNTAKFSTKPVAVEGEFLIDEFEFDGVTRAVFLIKGEKVE